MTAADKIKALLAQGTPGPWLRITTDWQDHNNVLSATATPCAVGRLGNADARLICALVNAAPQIAAALEAARLPHAYNDSDAQVCVNGHWEGVVCVPKSEFDALAAALAAVDAALPEVGE